jgi:hypothetical protein
MKHRMHAFNPALRNGLLILAAAALTDCGARLTAPEPALQEPVSSRPNTGPGNMAGRWLLSSPGQGQCHMNFGAAADNASQGTIAPEGGCPGKFFTSRKWSFEQSGLVIRDHNGKALAYLSGGAAQFTGKAATGEAITLLR